MSPRSAPRPRLASPDRLSRRRALGLLALLPVLAAPLPARAADPKPPTAKDVAGKVQKFYDDTKTFKASFTQVYFIKVQNKKKDSKGRVVFEKPGKMSFTYDEPNGNRVVSDGTVIKVYEREAEQMYESPVAKSQYPAALAFLMGEGKLTSDFKLKLLDSATMKFEGGWVLECVPKEASPAYSKMLLYVDASTAQVRRVLLLDAQGNRNRFDFSDPVVNEAVASSEFEFKPPKGTKIIKP
jgi:outer membrane lipoprotein carrier protein